MGIEKQIPVSDKWLSALDLQRRHSPELYLPQDSIVGSPHAGAIRDSFEKMGVSAIFCVQGVPTFAYLVQETYDQTAVIETHANLWNQGLASLLLVLVDDTLRIFSLAKVPVKNVDHEFERNCLIETLTLVEEALKIKGLISGAESGRLWQEHKEFFKVSERVDTYLLGNLLKSHEELTNSGLDTDAAQALLMQTMFISYLEDRGIINEAYYCTILDDDITSLHQVCKTKIVKNLEVLFNALSRDFNGNMFVSPCSFEPDIERHKLTSEHLLILGRFRSGKENMKSGQLQFWGYNFQYIPVELISAVYDRFLGEKEIERRELGAYYTPMFLADTVMAQVWDSIPISSKRTGAFLDPACGSGVFLVRSFQLLCEQWKRDRNVQSLHWSNLCATLQRVHGWDVNGNAVRVAIFSLYIALLEQVSPPDIKKLIKKGKILPELWGKTLVKQDFFAVDTTQNQYDVIVGNPPWASNLGVDRKSTQWCETHDYPMPNKEDAWAFTWKSLCHLKANGMTSFLVPTMSFLHNPESFKARAKLVRNAYVSKIINFSDLRFQLFDGAISPSALITFGPNLDQETPYIIEYWVPKANMNLKTKRSITITGSDKTEIKSREIETDPSILKTRLWMRKVDKKLYNYLSSYERLSDFIKPYGRAKEDADNQNIEWFIGQGFEAYNEDSTNNPHVSYEIVKHPYLPINAMNRLYQPTVSIAPWHTQNLRRKGFEFAYGQSKILISRMIETSCMRLKASYCSQKLSFKQILMGITFPKEEASKAKILTAYLNSKLAIWFAFHGTPSFGAGRPEVKQTELLKLPFPSKITMVEDSETIEQELLNVIDALEKSSTKLLTPSNEIDVSLRQLDLLIYRYFGLSNEEVSVIEDTVNYIIPASQPSQKNIPDLWKPINATTRIEYVDSLTTALNKWLQPESNICAKLIGKNDDFAILELSLNDKAANVEHKYVESDSSISASLTNIMSFAKVDLPGNFTLIPDFRLFHQDKLYLVKPLQRQYWMKSSALEDANSIALDIQTFPSKTLESA